MLAQPEPEDFFFQYEATLHIIIEQTGWDRREHSRHEFALAEQCRHQPRSAGRQRRPDLAQARADANICLLRQSYCERLLRYLPFMDEAAQRRAAQTLKNLSDCP